MPVEELEATARFELEMIAPDVLKQKFLLQKGLLLLAFNQKDEARNNFFKCLRTG